MKHKLHRNIHSGKRHFHFLFRLSIALTLWIGGVFPFTNVFAYENQAYGDSARVYHETPAVPQAVLYLPLSTWIGVGDIIRLKAFPDTAQFITGDYLILENGFAMLPVLGLVQVTNLSIAALTENLTKRYAKYLAYPTIQIEPIIRLSFLGGFINPGMHKVNPMGTFSDALSASQGTIRDDGLKLLRWERGGQVMAKDMTSNVEGNKSLLALGIKSGDQICITILTKRDRLPMISLILSTLLATGTLAVTLLVLSR